MSKELYTIAPKKWEADFGYAAPTLDATDGVHVGDIAVDNGAGNANRRWICADSTDSAPIWSPVLAYDGTLYMDTQLSIGSPIVNITQFATMVPGTVSNDLNGTVITGVGTLFLSTFNIGDIIDLSWEGGAQGCVITSITSDTELEVTEPIPHANSNITYSLVGSTSRFTVKANGNMSLTTGAEITEFSIDGTMAGNSDKAVPTEKAVKTYADTKQPMIAQDFSGAMPTLDITDGVVVGNVAVDSGITPAKVWRCLDNTDGAPFWREIDLSYPTAFGPSILAPQDLLHLRGNDTTPDAMDITHNNIFIEAPTGGDAGLMIGDEVTGQRWYLQNYRGEASDFIYLWNQLGRRDVLTVNTGGRVGFNKPSDLMEYHSWYVNPATGALDDMDLTGQYSSRLGAQYEVAIAATGGTDTFKWRRSEDDGETWGAYSTPADITGIAQLIDKGMYAQFGHTTGHNTNDVWRWQAISQLPGGSLSVNPAKYHEINHTSDYTAGSPVWQDVTYPMSWTAAGSVTMPSTGTTSAVYVGDYGFFNTIYFVLDSAAEGMTLRAEYYNTTTNAWEVLDSSHTFSDGTANMTKSGTLRWDKVTMPNWGKHIPPNHGTDDNYNLYWIRVSSSTNITVAPVISLVSLHGASRFAVYAGHLDSVPSFHVDVQGRTSIGTKVATGNNQLQVVYPYRSVPSATTSSSIMEVDSGDSNRAEFILRLSQATATGVPSMNLTKSRGSLTTPANLVNGDEVGRFRFMVYAGGAWNTAGGHRYIYAGDGTTTYGHINFYLNNNSTDAEAVFRVDRNTSTGNGIIQMYNNTTAVGVGIEEFSSDGTLAGNSDLAVPTEKAVKTYVDTEVPFVKIRTARVTTIQNSTTSALANVTELTFPVEANKDYYFEFEIIYQSTATNTGINFSINGPATPTSIVFQRTIPTSATANNFQQLRAYDAGTTTSTTEAANSDVMANVKGFLRNGANAGTLALRFASESTTSVSVRPGSIGTLTQTTV